MSSPAPKLTPVMALPRRLRQTEPTEAEHQRYKAVIDGPRSPQDVEWLLQVGILGENTRWRVLSHLSWHLIHVKGLSQDEAVEFITTWLFNPRHRSRMVRQALERGDRSLLEAAVRGHVKAQVRYRNQNHERRLRSEASHAEPRFTRFELDALRPYLDAETLDERARRKAATFVCHVWAFCRRHGTVIDGYPEAYISTHGIMRKIKGFTNSRAIGEAKDWAIRVGLMTVTEAKRQSHNKTGAPCRYRIGVTVGIAIGIASEGPAEVAEGVYPLEQAITYLTEETAHARRPEVAAAATANQEPRPVPEGHPGGSLGESPPECGSVPHAPQTVLGQADHGKPPLPPIVVEPGVPFSACGMMFLPHAHDMRSLKARRKEMLRRQRAAILREQRAAVFKHQSLSD
jgi:hypothetical protein